MKKLFTLITSLLLLAYSFTYLPIYSVSADEITDQEKKVAELEKKVASLKTQAKTLADQIVYYDSQIELTGLKISQTQELVASLTSKIEVLENSLRQRSQLLQQQIVQTYKQGGSEPLSLMLSADDFSQLVSKFKYIQIIQNQNRKFLHDTQLVQSNYATQKNLIEVSRVKLEQQKQNLANLRVERDNLLKQTKNDEVVYQRQLEAARLELESIKQALALGLKEGPVKAGDAIAVMGNSGYPSCSTGAHLHFEIQKNGQWVNAESYLKRIVDRWGMTIGSGDWDWPMRGDIEITQRYGKTDYSWKYIYSGGIHTGVDMVSSNTVIYAPKDGTLYSYTGKCGSSNLNIKYIDHGDGLKSLYLHVK